MIAILILGIIFFSMFIISRQVQTQTQTQTQTQDQELFPEVVEEVGPFFPLKYFPKYKHYIDGVKGLYDQNPSEKLLVVTQKNKK